MTHEIAMSREGINEQTGTINLYDLIPQRGDCLTVINCGTHFEIRYQRLETPPLTLTDEDIEAIREGRITYN